ncbi:HipA N-terminal domain-containing protein [Siccibacter colletis]|uniref:HipA N-terminal domain-containing protein n=1 Tax=Siccibacter colletis TaxID=1505757 RepID=UPI0028BD32DF|nr:HipA N-terminal domain-containing protein [Siccibacter colletis]WNN48690.1 HipA N-terminal domain-containing protein [Siccibacter colletis]
MLRRVAVRLYGEPVGVLEQSDAGFCFTYHADYQGPPLSLSLPVSQRSFPRATLHPFFVSLAPEGWLKRRYSQIQHLDEKDLLGMLIHNGKNLIGAVQIEPEDA